MSTVPIEKLHIRALEQRTQLHRTVSDLRDKVQQTREKMKVSNQAREHLVAFSIAGGVVGFLSGYGVAGLFTRR